MADIDHKTESAAELNDQAKGRLGVNSDSYTALLNETNDEIGTFGFTKDSLIAKTIRSNGYFNRLDYDDWNSFYIFPRNDPYRMLGTTREYIFVTKPDLHIFSGSDTSALNTEIEKDPYFKMLMMGGYGDTVLANLQLSVDRSKPFIPLLSNYKTSSLELTSVTSEDIESGVNMYGTKLSYRNSSYRSDEFSEFSIEFKDTKYLDCYLWFKTYDLYERKKAQGMISPVYNDYIIHKIISDQMTIFKFIVGEDGETIVHWSCFWGCYPKNVPREVFSDMPADGQLKFSTSWHCSFQDDMDPLIIKHFNWLCRIQLGSEDSAPDISKRVNLYDPDIGSITQEKAFCPYIIRVTNDGYSNNPYARYQLVWYKQ